MNRTPALSCLPSSPPNEPMTEPETVADRPLRHKTLSAYYPRLETLGSYLTQATSEDVVFHSDPQEYRDLLSTIVCAPVETSRKAFPPSEPAYGSQQGAVDRILSDVARKRGTRGDVLVHGLSSHESFSATRFGGEPRYAGVPSTVLRERPWAILRSRLGDAAFHHIFLHTSLFLPLDNNCYIQLCGLPVVRLYDHATTEVAGHKRVASEVEGRKFKRRRKEPTNIVTTSRAPKTCNPSSVDISRQRIFYGRPNRAASGKLVYGFTRTFILNKVMSKDNPLPSDAACEAVLQDIFPGFLRPAVAGRREARGSSQRLKGVVGAVRELIMRHAKIDFRRLMKVCLDRLEDVQLVRNLPYAADIEDQYPEIPLPVTTPGTAILERYFNEPSRPVAAGQPPMTRLDTRSPAIVDLQPVTHSQVYRFLNSVLRHLLSSHLAGSEHNLTVLSRNIRTLITAKMHEPISLHSLMQGLRINDMAWLCVGEGTRVPPQESTKRRRLAEQFVLWLFDKYLIPLLQASFYVTETAATRYETVYYAHDAWASATEPHLRDLESSLLEELTMDEEDTATNSPFGVSAVRLIPKPNGFRPIVNLGKRVKPSNQIGVSSTSGKPQSANEILKSVHQILTYEKNRRRKDIGACLFGTNEVFAPLQSLKKELLAHRGSLPKLCFAKMDIKAAFDTIKQDKMLEVVDQLLPKDYDYCLMVYAMLLPPASKGAHSTARRLYKTRASVADASLSVFGAHARDMVASLRNAIVVDTAQRKEVTRQACLDLLRTHIQNNVWQVGNKYFRQKTGIPQGSKISSLLCSFFYSWLENEHLSWTRRSGTRLLRYIDDFLLITDDYNLARRFVETMSRGFPKYGAFISPSKTLLSFEMACSGQALPVAALSDDGKCNFPYCGFLINTRTLDFSIDHERLMSAPTRQSFALRNNRHRGANFVGWLSRQLENRNHVAYLDTDHNALRTVYTNIFVNFALTTMKIPHYFSGTLDVRRAALVHGWICLAVEYTYNAGRARVKHAARSAGGDHYGVRKRAFMFVAKRAVARVLARKAGRFGLVVELLERDVARERRCGDVEELEEVVRTGWEMVRFAKF